MEELQAYKVRLEETYINYPKEFKILKKNQ